MKMILSLISLIKASSFIQDLTICVNNHRDNIMSDFWTQFLRDFVEFMGPSPELVTPSSDWSRAQMLPSHWSIVI